MVILAEAQGSAPQESGAKMLCDEAGLIHGTVGGGKVEAKALQTAADLLRRKQANTYFEWHLERDVGMTCGGRVKLYFETYGVSEWHIAVFGAGHVAQALIAALVSLNCRVSCADSRQEWLDSLPVLPKLRKIRSDTPATEIKNLGEDTFVLMMTQGHVTDFPVLLECLRREKKFPYVGVIGSKSKRAVLIKDLVAAGVDPALAENFHCPIGLKLGNSEPAEIAISIVAQLIQVRDAAGRAG